MTAEIALQRDDCGRAAANYTIAAQRLSDAKLAQRVPPTWRSIADSTRRPSAPPRAGAQLMPTDPAALRASMRAALGLYKIDDARGAFEDWIKSGGAARRQDARAAGSGAPVRGRDDAEAERLQVAQESGVPATLAMLRGVQMRAAAERSRRSWRWPISPSTAGTTARHCSTASSALSAGAAACARRNCCWRARTPAWARPIRPWPRPARRASRHPRSRASRRRTC